MIVHNGRTVYPERGIHGGTGSAAELEATYLSVLGTARFRTLEELQGFFGDLDMVEPGLVSLPEWRPESPIGHRLTVAERLMAGGIAGKR